MYITVAKFTITHATIQKLDIGMYNLHTKWGKTHTQALRYYGSISYTINIPYVTKYDLETQTM